MKKPKILVFIPMYNCDRQVCRVIRQFESIPEGRISEVLVIDNRSSDNSLELVSDAIGKINLKIKLIQNSENYSLGGSSKIAFMYGFKHNYDYLLIHQSNFHEHYLQRTPLLLFQELFLSEKPHE